MMSRAQVGVCIVLVLFAGSASADGDALIGFHRDFVARAGHGVQFHDPEIVCTVSVKLPNAEGLGSNIAFLAEKGRGVEVWALTDFQLTNMGSLWTGGDFSKDPDNPQTSEWGWVYDRNGDGWIDWLSYVDGSLPIVPKGGVPEGFPNLLAGDVSITRSQVAFLRENARVVYRHILDVDFDREPDHVVTVPISQGSGFGEGVMLFSVGGDGPFSCVWQSDYNDNDKRSCAFEDGAFITVGDQPTRRAEPPLDALALYWLAVTRAAANCSVGSISTHP